MSRSKIEDDNRTIADMSSLERPSLAGEWFGRAYFGEGAFARKKRDKSRAVISDEGEAVPEDDSTKPDNTYSPSGEERRAYMFGTIRAGLLIGGAYILAFGLFIGLLLLLWK